MQIQRLTLCVSTLVLSVHALDFTRLNDTNRYIPGPWRDVSKQMAEDLHGAKQLGGDGVLRSFASNGTVLDYHQLDPEQVRDFLEGHPGTGELTTRSYADGRLVTDLQELLHPADKPNMTPRDSSAVETPEGLFGRQAPDICKDKPCHGLSDCKKDIFIDVCTACYFEHRPVLGHCRH